MGSFSRTLGLRRPAPTPAEQQTLWFVDPLNLSGTAHNGNAGNAPNAALLDCQELVFNRLGSPAPNWEQGVQIFFLSNHLSPVFLDPLVSGVGTNIVLRGVPQPNGADFPAGIVTPKFIGSPGNDLEVTGIPGDTAAGDLFYNVTRNSYAFVDSVGGEIFTATMQQPFTAPTLLTPSASPFAVEDNGWVAGNTIRRFTLPEVNVQSTRALGGETDTNSGVVWIETLRIPDVSGTPGNSTFACAPLGVGCVFSLCWLDPFVMLDSSRLGPNALLVAQGCHMPGGGALRGPSTQMRGGGLSTPAADNPNEASGGCFLTGDAIVHNALQCIGGSVSCGSFHSDGEVLVQGGVLELAGPLWGGGTIDTQTNAATHLASSTWALQLQLAAILLNSAGTGSSYAAGVWTDGFALTSALLDTHNGLQNPRTGARYAGT